MNDKSRSACGWMLHAFDGGWGMQMWHVSMVVLLFVVVMCDVWLMVVMCDVLFSLGG